MSRDPHSTAADRSMTLPAVETRIEADLKSNPNGLDQVYKELSDFRKSESADKFKVDLKAINDQLHRDGLLPNLDLVEADPKDKTAPLGFKLGPEDFTPPASQPDTSQPSVDRPDEKPAIDPNGNYGDGGGGGSHGGGDGGGSGGGGGGSHGGGDGGGSGGGGGGDASAGDASFSGTLGNGTGDATTAEVVKDAESQLGVPYVWGAASPGRSFDCSGLTMWAWKQAGINLPHNAEAQYNDTAHVTHVPLSQLKPGDLLFYNDGGSIHHVTMYVGNGKMIEAPHTGASVREVPVRTHGLMPMAGRPHK